MSETAGQADRRGEERTDHAERDPVDQQTPAYEPHRFEIGAFEATVVSDEPFSVTDAILASTPPRPEIDQAMRRVGIEGGEVPLHANVLAVNTGRELVLVDAGASGSFPFPGGGRLLAGLGAVGIGPGDVDAVILTHAHEDHIGGLLNEGGTPVFPNARYLLGRQEWEFWSADPPLLELSLDEATRGWPARPPTPSSRRLGTSWSCSSSATGSCRGSRP